MNLTGAKGDDPGGIPDTRCDILLPQSAETIRLTGDPG
ncbi:hypothetical protein ASZ90_015517 [hydrocarbon metagenome]|uniref:Uncharacterized protein n=1 Tax=hydrocarbon metagenome TaxID=938273 RepID=A0A0W8F2M7_9ZZZZ